MSEWIKPADKLPEPNTITQGAESDYVLICDAQGDISVGFYTYDYECFALQDGNDPDFPIVAWMPLPSPPCL